MRYRRRRGTLAEELGKTAGGVLAALGTLAFCKAMFTKGEAEMQPWQASTYRSTYFGGSGDLFAPFPPEHLHYIIWIGLAMAVGGSLLRLASYWRITSPEESHEA